MQTETRWTPVERFVFLMVACFLIFCQSLALAGMGWLWVVAGYWALAGLLVIVPPMYPIVWLIIQATRKEPVDDEPAIDERPSLTVLKLPKLYRKATPIPTDGPAPTEIDIRDVDPQTLEAMMDRKKRRAVDPTTLRRATG